MSKGSPIIIPTKWQTWPTATTKPEGDQAMSKGSPIITVRIPQPTIDAIERHLARINRRRRESPYTLRTFIIAAVMDKLAHIDRSRVKRINDDNDLEASLTAATVAATTPWNQPPDPREPTNDRPEC